MIAILLAYLVAADAAVPMHTMMGHLLSRKGRVYLSVDANAGLPEYAVSWAAGVPNPPDLCFWNINHACRRVTVSVETVRLKEHRLLGVRLVRPKDLNR